LITSLFTVQKKGSNKKRTYLLHRHRQDNAAEREHTNRKLTHIPAAAKLNKFLTATATQLSSPPSIPAST